MHLNIQLPLKRKKKKGINATLSALEMVDRVHKVPFLSESLLKIFTELQLQVVCTFFFFFFLKIRQIRLSCSNLVVFCVPVCFQNLPSAEYQLPPGSGSPVLPLRGVHLSHDAGEMVLVGQGKSFPETVELSGCESTVNE